MKRHLLLAGLGVVAACSGSGGTRTDGATTSNPDPEKTATMSGFRPTKTLWLNWHDGGPTQGASLPVPIKQDGRLLIVALQIAYPTIYPRDGKPVPEDEATRIRNEVSAPQQVVFLDPRTGEPVGPKIYMNEAQRVARYGLRDPAGQVVGHLDDPNWLPKNRVDALKARIFTGLDVLLPLFADESQPWTVEANKAAQEVRDFSPRAAEPGLWPYYRIEGREFFAWVEKNAPAAKAHLPWEEEER